MESMPVHRAVAEQRAHLAREILEVLLFAGLILFIVHFAVDSVRIADTIMSPELQPDQIVLVNSKAYAFGGPSRGDVVLMANPQDPTQQVLRRVIAVPGDTLSLTATSVIVDGVTLKEPYINVPAGQAQNNIVLSPKTLGPNEYYVLGDNRVQSGGSDSRSFGIVPAQNIVGKAVMVFWPFSAFHWISSYSSVFSNVHGR